MVVEDYLLSIKTQGDPDLQTFLKNFAEQQYKGIATYLLQTRVCCVLIKFVKLIKIINNGLF